MADNIVGGLFGLDPAQYDIQQRQQRQQEFARDFQSVQLSPMEQSKLAILQGTRAFGRGVGQLLGGEDPQLQKVSAIKQLSSQFDLTSPVGMRDFARSLQAQFPQEAMLAAKRADEMETSGLGRQKTQADIERTQGLVAKEELAAGKEEQLRTELANLPPNATEAQVIEVVRKYGSPDKILQILQRSEDAKLRRAEIAATKGAASAKEDKPLPAGTVKEIATAVKTNNTLNRTNTTLDNYILEVDENKIKFNLGTNIAGWVQRGTGRQDANTLKQVSLKKFLENERNNILLAAKGTQTEGDANRAMSQIFDKTDWTSNTAVSQALSDLKDYKNSQIDSNNVFIDSLRGGGLPTAPAAPTAPPKATPPGKDYAADYQKYKAKYKDKAVSYEAYVATRTGKQ
jgi:hypothetical protein